MTFAVLILVGIIIKFVLSRTKEEEEMSIFFTSYILEKDLQLNDELVVTRDLPDIDFRLKKNTMCRVIGVIDEYQHTFLLEFCLNSELIPLDDTIIYIAPFVSLKKINAKKR